MMPDVKEVLITSQEIEEKVREIGARITEDYRGEKPLLVGILRGAVVIMSDLMRSIDLKCELDFMDISSYGSGSSSSGVVRILKDLDTDITGRHVLVVDEIIDTGLTLSWLASNLSSRSPASVTIATLLRKPEAQAMPVAVKYVGWDIPNEFVVGYGLDFDEHYRHLPHIAIVGS